MNSKNCVTLSKIIGAVESGGQIYGNARYDAYAGPYTNTPNEHTITLGWAQNYGHEAKKLIQMIYDKDPATFKKLDNAGIKSMLSKDWVAIRWNPSAAQKKALIALISSDVGRQCQDELFMELMKKFVADCEATYTKSVPAVMMYCEIRHLGGKTAADRIFKRCNGNYSLGKIMAALKMDQDDTSSSNQVGDRKFQSRHDKCVEFIQKYAVSDGGKETMTPLQRAKKLLRQPQGCTMTGYTPDGKSYFVSAGAWTNNPKKGDVIYFYSSDKGRVGHVGIVEKVDENSKTVYTIEGNTRSDAYAENGGCVARHSYSYRNQGGTNRVNGFGRPDFAGAGVTAEQFVNTAIGELGYLEKRSNKDLDSKTANAGSNNFQKYQRDVGAGNGSQWCQFFTDAVALYTCQGGSTPETLNEDPKWTGYVTKDELPVRTWAGAENDECTFSPLKKNTAVGVCDELKAKNGDTWYYILYNGKHGFVSGKYITKDAPGSEAKKIPAYKVSNKVVKHVADTARIEEWVYDDSHALPPCSDHKISCDRLEALALWLMGFHDQREGGETCGTLSEWLPKHGWTKVTDRAKIKAGAIVAVRKKTHSYIDHVFYVAGYNRGKDTCTKFDTGSNARIQTVQPFRDVPIVEWSDRVFVCAWNCPSWLSSSTPGKYIFEGVDYYCVFNPTYYAKMHPDVVNVYGTDKQKLFQHFCDYGMKEGRQACAGFNVLAYKARYKDLRKAFGDDLPTYYKHYCIQGITEDRIGI